MSGRPPQLLAAAGAALALHAAAALWLDALGPASTRPADRAAPPLTLRLAEAPGPNASPAPPVEPPTSARPSQQSVRPTADPDPVAADTCPSAASLERVALPYSQPDWQALDGSLPSGRALRLRLRIDALGQVRRIDAVEVAVEDADLLPRLRAILSATRYVPARQAGRDLASCLDLSIEAAQAD